VSDRGKQIADYLMERDPLLGQLIRGQEIIRPRRGKDPYPDLLQAVLSQQLSVKAADTIIGRFLKLFPDEYPTPDHVLVLTEQQLRSVGLSRQKAGYVKNIAAFALRGGLDRKILSTMTDDEVVHHLTEIKGVGRWTVEMLLMFTLNRPDVMPVDDLGIQNAMIRLYRLRTKEKKLHARMFKIAEVWKPYRSYACRYLWRSKDNAPG